MKILLVNNFYYNRGGDCTYMFSLKKVLEENGHKVIVFSMQHPNNFKSEYSEYFVSYINYADMVKNINILSGLKVLLRSLYSMEAKRKIVKLIKKEEPDIAHLHNIRHHITPSILRPLKKYNIPIIWTLHDYQLICPNISFLAQGKLCERCKQRKYYWPLLMKCKKGSLPASAMAAVEHSFQMITRKYDMVDFFLCPSQFLRKKFIEYGFDKNKLVHIGLFTENALDHIDKAGEYMIYVGRLSDEKGIFTLIDAVLKTDLCKLKIVGDGPLKKKLISYVNQNDHLGIIEFLGHKSHEEVMGLLSHSRCLILPSEWYENCPYVILEAFASGKAVIGSRIGGIPEHVKDYETGLTFEPGNVEDLRVKIEYLAENDTEAIRMGMNALKYLRNELNADRHYKKLMGMYNKAIDMH